MTVMIITIVVAWILFSGFVVTFICVNSSRLSRIDEPFKDPSTVARARRRKVKAARGAQPTTLPLSAET